MVVIVCFQSQRIVCSKSSGSERRIEWTYLQKTLPRWRLVLQWRFLCRLPLKPDNNFTLWPGFMPVSHTIIPSNRLWAPKLSKHFVCYGSPCKLVGQCRSWLMEESSRGGASRERERVREISLWSHFRPISLVQQTCRVLGFKRNLHSVDLNYTGRTQLYSASMWPQSCISNGQTSRLTLGQQI